MKVAIYIEQGDVQLVLTPEGDYERNALKSFLEKGEYEVSVKEGSFYECRGGHWRLTEWADASDKSLILRSKRIVKTAEDQTT